MKPYKAKSLNETRLLEERYVELSNNEYYLYKELE